MAKNKAKKTNEIATLAEIIGHEPTEIDHTAQMCAMTCIYQAYRHASRRDAPMIIPLDELARQFYNNRFTTDENWQAWLDTFQAYGLYLSGLMQSGEITLEWLENVMRKSGLYDMSRFD